MRKSKFLQLMFKINFKEVSQKDTKVWPEKIRQTTKIIFRLIDNKMEQNRSKN
jgi:hypothetical protein